MIPMLFARSVWNLVDALLIPDDWVTSSVVSFGIGNAGFLSASLALPLVQHLSAQLDSKALVIKLFVEDTFSVCNGVLHWFYWRGAWYLLTEIEPDMVVGGWSCAALGLVAGLLFGILYSQTNIECPKDGSLENGESIEFPNEYFRHLLRKKTHHKPRLSHDTSTRK